jgi:hypothetical protein
MRQMRLGGSRPRSILKVGAIPGVQEVSAMRNLVFASLRDCGPLDRLAFMLSLVAIWGIGLCDLAFTLRLDNLGYLIIRIVCPSLPPVM